MRLTTRLSTAGSGGFLSLPMLLHDGNYYELPNGDLNETLVRTELARHPCVLFSSDDDKATIAFTVELLDRMRMSLRNLMKDNNGVYEPKDGDAPSASERRFDKGKYVFVRLDIRHSFRVYRIKLSLGNPKEVVGGSEKFSRICAQTFADNIVAIRDDLNNSQIEWHLSEGDGCEGIFADAEERNRKITLRNKYRNCPNRHNGLCSPCKFGCELYKDGNCLWN